MCGIFGINKHLNDESISHIIASLNHRGPDNSGFYRDHETTLIHTRLSIIDLSETANQPMRVNNKVIIFNGEIYNYKELIKKYELQTKTNSDTEVIVLLYDLLGDDFLNELNGMFAFCIYDIEKKVFFCARDRFGKKPFYYYFENSTFIFGSEIKSILQVLNKIPEINKYAFEEYLSYLTPVGENTIYENIKRFESGCKAIYFINDNKLVIDRYYELSDKIDKLDISEDDALKNIEQLLIDSVKLRLVSDVPVVSFLSGGIDSSLVTKFYSLFSGQKIDTFSIGYNEYKKYDELEYAKIASLSIGTRHNEICIRRDDFIDSFNEIIDYLDEPLNDPAIVPTYILAKYVKKNNYKVVLTGEGSDEIFGGYDVYTLILHLLKLGNYYIDKPHFITEYKMNIYITRNRNKDLPVYRSFGECFNEDLRRKLLRYQLISNEDSIRNIYFNYNGIEDSFWISYIDIKHWIGEVLLTKLDRMCMLNSLEARSPFLDYRLVEYVLSLPDKIRFGDTTKYLIKKISSKYLPDEIINRRKKGFSSPYLEWYYDYYGEHVLKTFARVNKELGWFDESFIKYLFEKSKEGVFKQQIWGLIVFSRWFLKKYC